VRPAGGPSIARGGTASPITAGAIIAASTSCGSTDRSGADHAGRGGRGGRGGFEVARRMPALA